MRNNRSEFLTLACFLAIGLLVLTNGFMGRIAAQPTQVDAFMHIEPIGVVLDEILRNYVEEPDLDQVVEGALRGMMSSLDPHSAFVPPEAFEELTVDTEGQFEGIGVSIKEDENGNIYVYQPVPDSPAFKAGILMGDYIVAIDGESTEGLDLSGAARRIRGPRGTEVQLTILRRDDDGNTETLEFSIKRGRIPLESVSEWRLLDGGIAYIRISEFRKNTATEIRKHLAELEDQGMKALVLDLRWNPGGLLNAAKDVSEIFLPKNKLVTYTQGRHSGGSGLADNMELYTEREPAVPAEMPIVILTNGNTASSSEIVTGALQYWQRALVVGEKTFGKGSVQTIIQLERPPGSALRLTTAYYYTPAQVCIDKTGILPDVEVTMEDEHHIALIRQLYRSFEDDPEMRNRQNHGSVTGDELDEDTVEDTQLLRAVEILREEPVFERLLATYHRDTSETQLEARAGEGGETAATATR